MITTVGHVGIARVIESKRHCIVRYMHLLPLLQRTLGKHPNPVDWTRPTSQRHTHEWVRLTDLVSRGCVTPLVLAYLALCPLVPIEDSTVAATPARLKVGVRRHLKTSLRLLRLVAHEWVPRLRWSCYECCPDLGRLPRLSLAQALARFRWQRPQPP